MKKVFGLDAETGKHVATAYVDKKARKHHIVSDGRKENGIHRSSYGATNGKCNNCNSYMETCFCSRVK